MRWLVSGLFAVLVALAGSPGARAWEPTTTHAGLTEQAALQSALHQRLRERLGLEQGLFTSLTVPPADAPELFAALRKLDPNLGYVPDARGRLVALSWLIAGAVLADVPSAHAAHHFLDPRTGKGLSDRAIAGAGRALKLRLLRVGAGPELVHRGKPAHEWAFSAENPMGYPGFVDQFRKAVVAATPAERNRHLAGSLLAAGSMLHILQDMGSPSHVRNDLLAHLERIGADPSDRGSRFERLASLGYGRLGLPVAVEVPAPSNLFELFTSENGTGLADWTEKRYFSAGTLPSAVEVPRNATSSELTRALRPALRRSEPDPSLEHLNLVAARQPRGATLRNEHDTCLARYHWREGKLGWSIDDDCALEQLAEILPIVVGYGRHFLDGLYPAGPDLRATQSGLEVMGWQHTGTITFLADDVRGQRTNFHTTSIKDGVLETPCPLPPSGTVRVAVLFERKTADRSWLATSSTAYPIPTAAPARAK